MILSHQSAGTSPLSYTSLNNVFKNGKIWPSVDLNISITIPSGPGDLPGLIDFMLLMISSSVIGLSRSLAS